MAKKSVNGGGIVWTARLNVQDALKDADKLRSKINSVVSESGKIGGKAFDPKPMSAFQQGIFSLKKELQEKDKVWKEAIITERLAKAQSAESKAAIDALKISEQELNNQLKAGKVTAEEYALAQKKIVDAQKLAVAQQKEADRQAGEANKRLKEQLALARQQEAQAERNRKRLERESSEYYKLNQALNNVRGKAKDVLAEMFKLERQGKQNTQEYKNLAQSSKDLVSQTNILDKGIKGIDASLGLHQRNVGNYSEALAILNPRLAAINNALSVFGTSIEQLAGAGGMQNLGTQIVSVGRDILKFLISPVGLAITALTALYGLFVGNKDTVIDFDDKLLDVGKTTNLAGRDLLDLGKSVIELSKNLKTISSSRLLEYAAVAGSLGVSGTKDILAFSEALAKLEIASNISGEEGAAEIARLLTLTDGGVQNVQAFGDEVVNLGNAFSATEKEILANAEQISQNTGLYKLGRQDVLAYATATKSVGLEAEVVGSAFNRTLSTFEKAIRTGKNADELAKQTGLSIDQLKSKFKTDAAGVFNDFIKGLNGVDKSGGSVNEILENLGIVAVRDQRVIATLATSGFDTLNKAIVTVKNSSGALTTEFDTASGKLKNHTAKFGIAWDNLVLSVENGQGIIGKSSAAVVGFFTDIVSSITPSTKSYELNLDAVTALTGSYDRLTSKAKTLGGESKLTKDEQEELRKVTAQLGELMPGVITQFDKYGNALDINRGKISEMTKAQRELLELQNRTEIKKANDKFSQAQKYLPEAQKMAVLLNKSERSLGDKVYDFLYGGDRNRDSQQAAKDRITRLSATSYDAAKAIQKLGGTLSKAQQDIITYYEKTNEVIKKGTAPITIPVDDENKGARTADVIKKEIKAIQELQKPLDVASKEYAENVKKIKALKKELAEANGTYKAPSTASGDTELKAQRTLQEKFDKIATEARRKNLAKDESEIQAVKDKYAILFNEAAKFNQKVDEFNKDPKNKTKRTKVNTSGLVVAQSIENDVAVDNQSANQLKTEFDLKKNYFDDFEKYKLQIGSENAKKLVGDKIASEDTYLQYLKNQESKLLGINDTGKGADGGGERKQAQLKAVRERIKAQEDIVEKSRQDDFVNAFNAAKGLTEKLLQIDAEYNKNKSALGDKATKEQLDNLERIRSKAVSSAVTEDLTGSDAFNKLFLNLDELATKEIESLIKEIETKFNNLTTKFDPVDLEAIRKKLNEAKSILIRDNPFAQVSKAIEELNNKSIKGVKKTASQIKEDWINLGNATQSSFKFVSDAINSADFLKDAIGDIGATAIAGLASIAAVAIAVSTAIKTAEKSSKVLLIITAALAVVQALANIFKSIFAKHDKDIEKSIDTHKDQVKALADEYNNLERAVSNAIGESVYQSQQALIRNLKLQQEQLIQARNAELSKKKVDTGKVNEFNSQIQDAANKIEDVNKQISESLIQTNFKDLSNEFADAITDAYTQAANSSEAFDAVFNKTIANAIKNSLKLKLLEPVISDFTDALGDYAKNNNNSVLGFDFDNWKAKLEAASKTFAAGLKGADEYFKDPTSSSSSAGQASAVVGTITSAGLNEDTANKAMGVWRGTYDQTKLVAINTLKIANDMGNIYQTTIANFNELQAISNNTLRTANNTDRLASVEKAVVQIAANTSSGGSYLGLLGGGTKP